MRSKLFGTIRSRMVLIYMLVTVVAMVVTCVIVSVFMEQFLVSQRTTSQLQQTARLAAEVADEFESKDQLALYSMICDAADGMGGRVLVLDGDAVVQADSASQQNGFYLPYREVRDVLVTDSQGSYGFHQLLRTNESSGLLAKGEQTVWVVYYTAPLMSGDGKVGVLLFSTLIQDVVDSVNNVMNQVYLVFSSITLAIGLISFMVANWLTKPIVELTGAIRSMGKQGYGARVKVRGGDEIAELGSAFNRMSERIEDHDRVRDEFIANASHELKTPLSTMKLLSESILYDENASPEVMREFFTDVNSEMDRLSRIVTDLLRLVQDDTTEAKLVLAPVRMDEMVTRVIQRLKPLADDKKLTLAAETSPVTVQADALRLEQVIVNLTENAIKYTDNGGVTVRLMPSGNEAVLTVKDTGIGMPEEAIPHLFERFYRVDKARSRGTGGTGLGLSIVEKTITLHNGSIEVESAPGAGSTFTVRLPLFGGGEQRV